LNFNITQKPDYSLQERTFRELFESGELSDFDRAVMSLENKIRMSTDDNEKLQLQHQLEKLLYQKVNKEK